MTTPVPNTNVRLNADIQGTFGGTNPTSMSEYYRGGANVNSTQTTSVTDGTPIPTSGTIRMGMFRGLTKTTSFTPVLRIYTGSTPTALTETVPTGATNVVIEAWGSGGPGGAGAGSLCNGRGGGGGGGGGYSRTSVACSGGQTFSTTYGSAAASITVTGGTITTMNASQGSSGGNGTFPGSAGTGGPGGSASGGNQANVTGNAGSTGCFCTGGSPGSGITGTVAGDGSPYGRGTAGQPANIHTGNGTYGAANYRTVVFYYT